MRKRRSIPICILLCIVTCGIYAIYWFVSLTNEINELSGHINDTSGGMSVLFTILTCGIYSIYWSYKMGEKLDEVRFQLGVPRGSQGVIYLILSLFQLDIVAWCLMQNELNKCPIV